MQIFEKFSLQKYNTLNIDINAKKFIIINSYSDIKLIYKDFVHKNTKIFFLGNGSNILLTKNIDSLVINNNIKEIKIIKEDSNSVIVEASGGTNWHSFLEYCLSNGFYGLENLALIPGSVGAAPVQNIGAYGVEQKDYFYSAEVFDFSKGMFSDIFPDKCGFAYRFSNFKTIEYSDLYITKVRYKLNKIFIPNIKYKDLQLYLNDIPGYNPEKIDAKTVFDAICSIRIKKLPDYKIEPNAGSFFKNPIVSKNQYEHLISLFPDGNFHKINDNEFKVSAAYLIEKAGWKGKKLGDVEVSPMHSLIITNQGKATGVDILNFSNEIASDIFKKFGVLLEPEIIIL